MAFYDALTDFIFVEDEPQISDVIFLPGGLWGEIALRAANLYHRGYAPLLIPSGKHSILTDEQPTASSPPAYAGKHYETEADFLSSILQDQGVPKSAILLEREATFTYENAILSRRLTDQIGLTVKKGILCCQAYHARRALMYYQCLYPDTSFFVCPAVTQGISRKNWLSLPSSIDLILGEVERCGSQFHEILKEYHK